MRFRPPACRSSTCRRNRSTVRVSIGPITASSPSARSSVRSSSSTPTAGFTGSNIWFATREHHRPRARAPARPVTVTRFLVRTSTLGVSPLLRPRTTATNRRASGSTREQPDQPPAVDAGPGRAHSPCVGLPLDSGLEHRCSPRTLAAPGNRASDLERGDRRRARARPWLSGVERWRPRALGIGGLPEPVIREQNREAVSHRPPLRRQPHPAAARDRHARRVLPRGAGTGPGFRETRPLRRACAHSRDTSRGPRR